MDRVVPDSGENGGQLGSALVRVDAHQRAGLRVEQEGKEKPGTEFLNIYTKKISENIGVFCSNFCPFLQKFDPNIGF
jgi:hypothetical protein